MVKARTSSEKSSTVNLLEKCRLASPAVLKSCPKLRSACPVSSGTPSSSSLLSETPEQESALARRWAILLQLFPRGLELRFRTLVTGPYMRTYLIRMFRLCTKARAEAARFA